MHTESGVIDPGGPIKPIIKAALVMSESRTNTSRVWIESLIVLGLALFLLSRVLSPTHYIDEYYHVLAAQSYLEDGTLLLHDGGEPYTRARGYTYAVAYCYQWFGESWATGRLPSLLAGGLLVMSVFAWLHRTVGRRAAWIGAGLLVFAPAIINVSAMIRFYSAHMLFIWLAWVCAYGFIVGKMGPVRRSMLLVAGTTCALIATHLQTTTSIAALSIACWALTLFIGYLLHSQPKQARKAMFGLGLLILIGTPLFILALVLTGAWEHMAEKLTAARPWTEASRFQVQYYHRFFNEEMPLLWSAFPFIAVVALATRRRPAWFCLALFGSAFLVHSMLPVKGKRYLSYAWPCFFAIWAIGLDGLLAWLRVLIGDIVGQTFSKQAAARRWVGVAASCFLIVSLLFAWLAAPSYKLGRKMMTGDELGPLDHEDWAAAAETLEPIVDQTGFVLASAPPKAIYHLGRMDMGLSYSQAQYRPEFAIRANLNRPVIYSAQAMEQVMAEHPAGLIVVDAGHLGKKFFIPPETALYIETHTQPIDIPDSTRVKAFRWGPKP